MTLIRKNEKGITLAELVVYLGISGLVTLILTSFLVQSTKQRIETNNQQLAQHTTRQVLEKMSHSLRNAYDVDVLAGGDGINIYSKIYSISGDPQTEITTYRVIDEKIYYDETLGLLPDFSELKPITDEGIIVNAVQFRKISSSLKIEMQITKGNREATLDSTIFFRQQNI
ncbi:MAG: hypothetical protein COT24_00830 [Candidatus Kerfeldbacteria bacterium CG08_land_8_20_14_0_20_40_16]|uniref:Type II secretion system protein n=1 Tax=Candidatus Kerfeldbacteria bacterium CG08_land_8_20_14_0_20_40_16 TaxID=2014244 RepID=A0A2H0YWQ2_9BACT|nr:MAG: hypothetical protein COT24_00830 [Candidatus Kerfeldbacteria bacterium CG08_land_8_20_14_0_20_40_16]